jgi:hypothetical protein
MRDREKRDRGVSEYKVRLSVVTNLPIFFLKRKESEGKERKRDRRSVKVEK